MLKCCCSQNSKLLRFPYPHCPSIGGYGFPFQMVIPLINIRGENFFGLKRCPQSFRLVWLMGGGTFTEAVSVAGATLAPSSQSNSRLTHTIRLKSIVGFQPYSCLDENCFCCIAIILKCLRFEMSNLTRSMRFFSLCG